MTQWYTFDPVDTLFFKGAQPMQAGEHHTAGSFFPPAPETMSGAIRTTWLKQHEISFSDYAEGAVDEHVMTEIGKAGENAPFEIIGPLFKFKGHVFIPTPYSWYIEKDPKDLQMISIFKSSQLDNTRLIVSDRLSSLLWVKGKTVNLETLGGKWMSLSLLKDNQNEVHYVKEKITPETLTKHNRLIVEPNVLFGAEPRTGVALNKDRTAKKGHLYTFTHYRLHKDVSLMFGVDKEINLNPQGVLYLGGEKRFGYYKRITDGSPFEVYEGNFYMSLSSIKGTIEVNDSIMATGKIQYRGGWDLKKKFHKPLIGFYPPGSVFNKCSGNNFINI